MAPALILVASLLLVIAGACALVFSAHVGRAGKPLWVIAGIVLVLAGATVGVYVATTGALA